jgi:acetyl esterase/lipase
MRWPARPSPRGWRPRGALGWIATVASGAVAVVVGLTLVFMLHPVGVGGVGALGAAGFGFGTSYLLLVAVVAVFGAVAWWRRSRLPITFLATATLVGLVISLWPTVALARWAADHDVEVSVLSALGAVPNRIEIRNSVTYTTTSDGIELHLDVWPATAHRGAGPGPALLHVHGGGWTGGTRGESSLWNREMAGRGFQVFDVEYRLAPQASITDEVGDVKCALGWIAEHAATYDVDAQRISVLGGSAGGNLAMLAAYSSGDPALPPSCDVPTVRVRSVVNLYGPSDLTDLYRRSRSRASIQPSMRDYLGGTPQEHPDRYALLSPITHVSAAAPPTLTLVGSSDQVVPSHALEVLHRALRGAGVANRFVLLPATDHGFDQNWSALSTQIARHLVPDFLAEHG